MNKRRKKYAVAFWILTIACMCLIFYLSAQPANKSSLQSTFITKLLAQLLNNESLSEHFVRKLAHFSEFAGLSFLFNWSMLFTKGNKQLLTATSFASAYAITDEIHQIFVEGRACMFTDWLIDTSGAILGMLVFLVIYIAFQHIKNKRKSKEEML